MAAKTNITTIDYINISSAGNALNFGNLTVNSNNNGGCSSSTRGIFAIGRNSAASPTTIVNNIEYITIASEGNAIDFGDLIVPTQGGDACSNAHGGL